MSTDVVYQGRLLTWHHLVEGHAQMTDKAMRAALQNSKELRTIGTFVPRRPEELAEWLDGLPAVVAPDLLVPHPIPWPVKVEDEA